MYSLETYNSKNKTSKYGTYLNMFFTATGAVSQVVTLIFIAYIYNHIIHFSNKDTNKLINQIVSIISIVCQSLNCTSTY